jgi:aminopeptidase
MKRADRVHLKAPGTDLTFSIKGIGAKMCKGDRNIPDGEVFSCPVKNSVNGVIHFNTPDDLFGYEIRKCAAGIQGRPDHRRDGEQHQTA